MNITNKNKVNNEKNFQLSLGLAFLSKYFSLDEYEDLFSADDYMSLENLLSYYDEISLGLPLEEIILVLALLFEWVLLLIYWLLKDEKNMKSFLKYW